MTDDALRASIALYNANRRLLAGLHARRADLPAVPLWQAANAALLMPPEDFQRQAPAEFARILPEPRRAAPRPWCSPARLWTTPRC